MICVSGNPGWVQSNLDVHVFKEMFGTGWVGTRLANLVLLLLLVEYKCKFGIIEGQWWSWWWQT